MRFQPTVYKVNGNVHRVKYYSVNKCSEKNGEHFIKGEPRLAIDLCEHAYFIEYGFDKERYLEDLLRHLDLSRLKSDETR